MRNYLKNLNKHACGIKMNFVFVCVCMFLLKLTITHKPKYTCVTPTPTHTHTQIYIMHKHTDSFIMHFTQNKPHIHPKQCNLDFSANNHHSVVMHNLTLEIDQLCDQSIHCIHNRWFWISLQIPYCLGKTTKPTVTFYYLLYWDIFNITSTETIKTIRYRVPRTATSTFTQLLSSELLQRYFTSTETVRTTRAGEPMTATSTFTQLWASSLLRCYLMFRDHKDY